MNITKRQLRRIIREERRKVLAEQPIGPEQGQHMQADTDALIVADAIQYAVFDALEELGVDADQADRIIQALDGRVDLMREALKNALYDYHRKLKMSGDRPKPRNV